MAEMLTVVATMMVASSLGHSAFDDLAVSEVVVVVVSAA
jgi:hypothetical protein